MNKTAEELPQLIAVLANQQKQLVIVLGEKHDSERVVEMENKLIPLATHLFVEIPKEFLDMYDGDYKRFHDFTRPQLGGLEGTRLDGWNLAPHVSFVDTSLQDPDNKRHTLIRNAINRAQADEAQSSPTQTPAQVKVMSALRSIHIGRTLERVATSNAFMAKNIADELRPMNESGKPYLAMVIAGSSHVLSTRNLFNTCQEHNLKKYLADEGITNVINIDLYPSASYKLPPPENPFALKIVEKTDP